MLSSNYDRFELEQDIMRLYSICEDIDLFLQQHIDGPRAFTEDEVWNILYGLRCMHELRLVGCWEAAQPRGCARQALAPLRL